MRRQEAIEALIALDKGLDKLDSLEAVERQGILVPGLTRTLREVGERQRQYMKCGSPGLEPVSTVEVIDKFLASKRAANLRGATIKSYCDTLRPFARAYPTLPDKPEQIEQYLAPHRGENTTAKNIYIVIRLLYNFAQDRDLLPFANPITKVQKPKGEAKPLEHLNEAQTEMLVNAIGDDRDRGIIISLYGLGLRLKETRFLRVQDIGEDIIRVVHGKERAEPVPLAPEFRDALLKLAQGKQPQDFIFQGRNGQPLSDSMIQLIIKRLFAKAGIEGVRPSPHTLRHSKGVLSTMHGLDSYSNKRLLRHASMEMTDRYNQLNLNELRQKDRRYNPLLRIIAKQGLGKKPDCAQC